jgi:FtsZ-interacting cell division protein ZipA
MEPNWTIVLIVIIVAILIIVFLIWRNLKDKEELEKKIIGKERASIPKKTDTEVETNDD